MWVREVHGCKCVRFTGGREGRTCLRLESLSRKYRCCSLYFLLFSAFVFLRPRCNTYSSTVSDAHTASAFSAFCWMQQGVYHVGATLQTRTKSSTLYIRCTEIYAPRARIKEGSCCVPVLQRTVILWNDTKCAFTTPTRHNGISPPVRRP